LIAALTAIAGAVVLAQQARDVPQVLKAGTGSIAGRIVSDGSPPQPVRRASVMLSEQVGAYGARMFVSDDEGRFEFTNLPAGRYLITATKAAYLPTAYGVTKPMRTGSQPTGTAIVLNDGQRMTDVTLRITRGAVITGLITGPDGRPIQSALVYLGYFIRSGASGARRLTTLSNGSTYTDARGVYRLFGIPPGDYYLISAAGPTTEAETTTEADVQRALELARGGPASSGVTAQSATARRPTVGYLPTFHPGTASIADATPVTLTAGEERGHDRGVGGPQERRQSGHAIDVEEHQL